MLEPKILQQQISDMELKLELVFLEEAEYFQGHFPQIAILPGVVQVHFAVLYAQRYLEVQPEISSVTRLKFANIIQPKQQVNLSLKLVKQKHKVCYKYESKHLETHLLHSSGELNFVES
jgi:3-hydroxymyristoyl/3-hydroxydecanoyl-(acyl carrier protein) dehydratase